MTRRLHPAALLLAAALPACTDTSCGEYEFMGTPAGEQCGLMGSFGFLYIDEDMARIMLEPYRELGDTDSPYYNSIPFWELHFRPSRLEPGAVFEGPDLIGLCSYFPQIGSGQGMYTYPATEARLRVVSESGRNQTGGMAWRFEWEMECEIGPSRGRDLIELGLLSSGYEGNPYGMPPQEEGS